MMVDFVLHWKVALNLSLDNQVFDNSNLRKFHRLFLAHRQEGYAFDSLLTHSPLKGELADDVTILSNTTNAKVTRAMQDTYTLLRKEIRNPIKTMH